MFEGMGGQGKVVGGHYINSTVSTGGKGDRVVETGFRGRKLTDDEVAEWEKSPLRAAEALLQPLAQSARSLPAQCCPAAWARWRGQRSTPL